MIRLGDRDYPKTANRLGASTIIWLNCVQIDGHNYWFPKVLRLNNLLDQRGRRVCKIMHIMSMKVVLICHSCASCSSTPSVQIAASIFLAAANLRIHACWNLQLRYGNQRHSVERGWCVRPLKLSSPAGLATFCNLECGRFLWRSGGPRACDMKVERRERFFFGPL